MKIWNVVAILSISCLFPILAQKQDNAIDTAGSTCENELGHNGQCIDKNDTHKCRFPLAKLECPDGKQCCKIFPTEYDSAALPLTKAKKCTKKCPCCVARITDQMSDMRDMQSTLNSTVETTNIEIKSLIESTIEASTNETKSLIESNHDELIRKINGIDGKLTILESCVSANLCESHFNKVFGVGCVHFVSDPYSWMDARNNCQSIGGDLFVARDTAHYQELARYLKNQNYVGDIWIGVKSGAWLNGRPVASSEWGAGEPDGNSDACGGTGTYRNYLVWDWDNCGGTYYSLCQKDN